eukprot:gene10974-biopygen11072
MFAPAWDNFEVSARQKSPSLKVLKIDRDRMMTEQSAFMTKLSRSFEGYVPFVCFLAGASLRVDGYHVPLDSDYETAIKEDLTMTPLQAFGQDCFASQPPVRFPLFRCSDSELIIPKFYGLERCAPSRSPWSRPTLRAPATPSWPGGIVALPCGGGKTVVALKIVSELACKTLIVVHKEFLLSQWRERIAQFLPSASVGLVKAGVTDTEGRDVVLASLQSLSMKTYASAAFSDFGLLIVDECHRVGTEVFSRALFKTTFRYSLGLSATPERKDGMTRAIVFHLGPPVPPPPSLLDEPAAASVSNKVVRVRVVRFSSDARESAREEVINRRLADGRMKAAPNISRMINNVCAFEPRTAFVVDLIKNDVLARAPDRRVLVLSDRKSQLQRVHDLLAEAGISVGFYWGGMKPAALKESSSRRVICATFPYAAEGMDIPALDTLVLASPKTDVVQSCGRITRFRPDEHEDDHPPLVVDVVDTFAGIFVAQSRKRQRFYASRGFLIN